eukprot:3448191-Rhodomonas_salina.3
MVGKWGKVLGSGGKVVASIGNYWELLGIIIIWECWGVLGSGGEWWGVVGSGGEWWGVGKWWGVWGNGGKWP